MKSCLNTVLKQQLEEYWGDKKFPETVKIKTINRETLRSKDFIIVNRKLVALFGLDGGVLFSDLFGKEIYFEQRDRLRGDGWFYNTQKNRERDTGLSPHRQRAALGILENAGLLEVREEGKGWKHSRQYFRINHECVYILLDCISQRGIKNLNPLLQDSKKRHKNFNAVSNNNKQSNNYNTNIVSKDTNIGFQKAKAENLTESKSSSIEHRKIRNENTPIKTEKEMPPMKRESRPAIPSVSASARESALQRRQEDSLRKYEEKHPQRECLPNRFLDKWNSLPNLSTHKKPNTKTYQKAARYIGQLRRGVFLRDKGFEPDYLKRIGVPLEEANTRVWSGREIFSIFGRINASLVEGNYPKEKGFVPRTLEGCLFNSHQGNGYKATSFFLAVAYNKNYGMPLAETEREKIKDPNPKATKVFMPLFERELSMPEKVKLFQGIKELDRFYVAVIKRASMSLGGGDMGKSLPQFCVKLVEYIDAQRDWLTIVDPAAIRTSGKIWYGFLEDRQEYYDKPLVRWFSEFKAGKLPKTLTLDMPSWY